MKGRQIKYSQAELDFIYANRAMVRRELTDAVNAKFGANHKLENIKALCTRKGWSTGRDGKFQKGNIPHPDAHAKGPNKTTFKKGNVPVNHRPIDSERISKDGYVEIKIAEPAKWHAKHRVEWEKHHGPIPKGHIVIFVDGNPLHWQIENLQMISRAEHAILNKRGLRNVPDEVKPVAITYGRLINRVREKSTVRAA